MTIAAIRVSDHRVAAILHQHHLSAAEARAHERDRKLELYLEQVVAANDRQIQDNRDELARAKRTPLARFAGDRDVDTLADGRAVIAVSPVRTIDAQVIRVTSPTVKPSLMVRPQIDGGQDREIAYDWTRFAVTCTVTIAAVCAAALWLLVLR
jgi:hypothetical protein